jgi:hypothetical protein
MKKFIMIVGVTFAMSSSFVIAHGGGTNSAGCHTDHKTGVYHCHTKN